MNLSLFHNYLPLILNGLLATVFISLSSILFGTMIGYVVFAMGRHRKRWVRQVAYWYRYIVRGMPLMVLLLLIFFVVLSGGNGFLAAILAFSINYSNFASANIQSSVDAVGRDQIEAAHALGLTRFQTIRYIIAPQAMRIALPTFKYNAVSLLKSTAVVGYIAITDLTQATQTIRTQEGESFLPLMVATIIYFALAWLICKLLDSIVKTTSKI